MTLEEAEKLRDSYARRRQHFTGRNPGEELTDVLSPMCTMAEILLDQHIDRLRAQKAAGGPPAKPDTEGWWPARWCESDAALRKISMAIGCPCLEARANQNLADALAEYVIERYIKHELPGAHKQKLDEEIAEDTARQVSYDPQDPRYEHDPFNP